MTDLIVKSGVKNALSGYQVSEAFYDALDAKVAALSKEAARGTKANDSAPFYHVISSD